MIEATASRTAYRVALRRAAHQVFDEPVVFRDPLALRIFGMTEREIRSGALRAPRRPSSESLRAFIVARACFAEEALATAAAEGFAQYVLLGAGLDTFAYRNPYPAMRVFEVDYPATQTWKLELLRENGITVPEMCAHVAVDFERDDVRVRLAEAGFRAGEPALFAWLGVVPYLSPEAMHATLDALSRLPAETRLVLDYSLPREMLPPPEQLALASLSARVARAGEPFRQFFSATEMAAELLRWGFRVQEDLDVSGINARWFAGRSGGIRVLGTGAHLLLAEKPAAEG